MNFESVMIFLILVPSLFSYAVPNIRSCLHARRCKIDSNWKTICKQFYKDLHRVGPVIGSAQNFCELWSSDNFALMKWLMLENFTTSLTYETTSIKYANWYPWGKICYISPFFFVFDDPKTSLTNKWRPCDVHPWKNDEIKLGNEHSHNFLFA